MADSQIRKIEAAPTSVFTGGDQITGENPVIPVAPIGNLPTPQSPVDVALAKTREVLAREVTPPHSLNDYGLGGIEQK